MASVTQRISQIKQPYGGYLPMKSFSKEVFDDGLTLNANENIHASLVGLAVDYLTRFSMGDTVDQAFAISYWGASNIGMQNKADFYMSKVTGLDDTSITYACKLAGFDVCYRASKTAYKPVEDIEPDTPTIENIRIMVKRSMSFWDKYGPIVCSEPTFEGGYSDTVNAGDGDFITQDTLWDFKVSKKAPTTKHSLQILMYYVMGLHSIHEHFRSITNLGFFNPRLNTVYICPVSSISEETIAEIENGVLCYGVAVPVVSVPVKKKSALSPKSNTSSDELSVAELSTISGIKKSTILADIRSGRLNAYKKGNKYYISRSDCYVYIARIRQQQKIQIGLVLFFVVVNILILLYFYGLNYGY